MILYSIDNSKSGNNDLDKLRSINKQILISLERTFNSIKKSGGSLYADEVKLAQYKDRIDQVSQSSVAADFLASIHRKVDYVKRALEASKVDETPVSLEVRNVIVDLKSGVV